MSLIFDDLLFERGQFRLGPLRLALPAAKRSVLLGPSGCGKTTLLRIVAGLETPASGRVRLAGRDLTPLPPQRRKIAMVFQNLALWPHMKAVDQIRYAGRCGPEQAAAWLTRVGLGGHGNRLPAELSGGEGQRVALARALAQEPDLLLLDEPLRSVDPHLRDDLQRLIRELTQEAGLTSVIVTHDREEALALAQHIVLLREGRVVESGDLDSVTVRPAHAFTASFLRGAILVGLAREGRRLHGPLGEFPLPPNLNGNDDLFLALLPGDLREASGGTIAGTLRDVVHGPHGLLGEVEVGEVRIRVPLDGPRQQGSTLALAFVREPMIVPGETRP